MANTCKFEEIHICPNYCIDVPCKFRPGSHYAAKHQPQYFLPYLVGLEKTDAPKVDIDIRKANRLIEHLKQYMKKNNLLTDSVKSKIRCFEAIITWKMIFEQSKRNKQRNVNKTNENTNENTNNDNSNTTKCKTNSNNNNDHIYPNTLFIHLILILIHPLNQNQKQNQNQCQPIAMTLTTI